MGLLTLTLKGGLELHSPLFPCSNEHGKRCQKIINGGSQGLWHFKPE